jgi:5-methyltetrahydrofolate--homocysteine methyltransferase
MMQMDEILKNLFDAIMEGNAESAKSNVQKALDAQMKPIIILNEGMIPAMHEVGCQFEAGEYFVPEMLTAARAMQSGMAILKPYLQQADVKSSGKVLIGTVKGDLHDIGKNLVMLMLEGAGFEVKDLGVDVSVEKFIQVAQEEKPDIVAMSALLTTTMQMMKQTIEAFSTAGLRNKVKIMIGGAPVTEAFASEIGADGFSLDASRAVATAKALISN